MLSIVKGGEYINNNNEKVAKVTLEDNTVTLRNRDTMKQESICMLTGTSLHKQHTKT